MIRQNNGLAKKKHLIHALRCSHLFTRQLLNLAAGRRAGRASTKPGTWNIPEHPGTFRNIPEHPGTGQIITK